MTAPPGTRLRTAPGGDPAGADVLELVVPGAGADAAACRPAVEAEVAAWARETGRAAPPSLRVVADAGASTPVLRTPDGSAPLSARRAEQVAVAALGRFRDPRDPSPVHRRFGGCWRAHPADRPALAAGWTGAALRTRVQAPPDRDAPAADPAAPGDVPRPVLPVVELGARDLREVTTRPPAELNEAVTAALQGLFREYGVLVPGIDLGFGAPGRVAFSFGGQRTAAHLLPAPGTSVVALPPEVLPAEVLGVVLDPATGSRWSVVDSGDAAGLDPSAVLDRLGYVLRILVAECAVRLPLWSSSAADAYRTGLWRTPGLQREVGRLLPALVGRLVAQRASAQYVERLCEHVLRGLARGDGSLDAVEDEARLALGSAVLGELALSCVPTVLDVDPGDVGGPPAALREELVTAHPELLTAVTPVVVRVPAPARRAAAAALAPLLDVVHVVSREELPVGPALRERWDAMGARRAAEGVRDVER